MLGHFGFSYVGLIYLCMLFAPNILWAKRKPEGYTQTGENKALSVFEKAGQVLVTCAALIFSDFNLSFGSWWSLWLAGSFALMLLYEACWLRYFKKPSLKRMYGSFLKVPVPLASLPVAAFLLLGVYGRVVWMVLGTVVLGIGHVGIHVSHCKKAGIPLFS